MPQVLQSKDAYPTQVTAHVICDNSEALRGVLGLWELKATVHTSQAKSEANSIKAEHEVYGMLWDHRKIVEEAVAAGCSSSYLCIVSCAASQILYIVQLLLLLPTSDVHNLQAYIPPMYT